MPLPCLRHVLQKLMTHTCDSKTGWPDSLPLTTTARHFTSYWILDPVAICIPSTHTGQELLYSSLPKQGRLQKGETSSSYWMDQVQNPPLRYNEKKGSICTNKKGLSPRIKSESKWTKRKGQSPVTIQRSRISTAQEEEESSLWQRIDWRNRLLLWSKTTIWVK